MRLKAVSLFLLSAVLLAALSPPLLAKSRKMSQFGEYRGYLQAIYDGYVRWSDYITLEDGRKLAYDLFLPTRKGTSAKEPLPVLFTHTPYLRAVQMVKDGKLINADLLGLNWIVKAYIWVVSRFSKSGFIVDQTKRTPWITKMIKHGYAVIVVEVSGTGASSGFMSTSFEDLAEESNEIINWIAHQPWCDGNIGMFGTSYVAMTQYAAASSGNPHLKAIFPCSASFDMYDAIIYPGGIFNKSFSSILSQAASIFETMVVPVDSDANGQALERILEERRKVITFTKAVNEGIKQAPFRDSDNPDPGGTRIWEDMGLYTLLEKINRSGVAAYNTTGWRDIFVRDGLLWHRNLVLPCRLLIRPLAHSDVDVKESDLDLAVEAHRWFDYWLKGINNGIMEEPPIYYYVMGAPGKNAWRTSNQWPLSNQKITRFYFLEGRTGTVASANDGFLRQQCPEKENGHDVYTVDYSATTGTRTRWNAIIKSPDYPDRRSNDEKSLTYTTSPLDTDIEVTGHPVVHLWVRTHVSDLDFFVYLEEVDKKGNSTYVTEGCLRASHRVLSDAPFDNLGLPYQRSYQHDLSPIPAGDPVELVFDLLPTSYLFKKGYRMRIAISCTDKDNFEIIKHDSPAEMQLLRNKGYASYVELPIISGRYEATEKPF